MVTPPGDGNFRWSEQHQLYVDASRGVWFDPDAGRYSDPYSNSWLPRDPGTSSPQGPVGHRHNVAIVEAPVAAPADDARREVSVAGLAKVGASLHHQQRFWRPLARSLWWVFLLPVALASWACSITDASRRRTVFAAAGVALVAGVVAAAVLVSGDGGPGEPIAVASVAEEADAESGLAVLAVPVPTADAASVPTTTTTVAGATVTVAVLGDVAYYSASTRQSTLAAIEQGAAAHSEVDQLLADLALLIALPAQDVPDFDPAVFGTRIDLDGDCVDVGEDVLRASAAEITLTLDGCGVTDGRWFDPYSGADVSGVESMAVIPVVSYADAWASGAWRFSAENLELFAGSPANNVAMSVDESERLGDLGPGGYTPTNPAQTCAYLARYAVVKVSWSLSISPEDHGVVAAGLRSCDRLSDAAGSTVANLSAPDPAASSTPADCHPDYTPCIPFAPGDAFDCDELPVNSILVAGLDPYNLDTDGDGVACDG